MTQPNTFEGQKPLITKLAAILGEIGQMKPQGRNSFHNYDYFTEGQLTAELRHKLASRNMFVLTSVESITREVITNQKGNSEQLVTISTTHTIYDGDTGSGITVRGGGMGIDPGDKGIYKAITGAMKYFLMKAFFISDAADPEADEKGDKARSEQEQHSPHREPEKAGKKAADVPTAKADLHTLITWMGENDISAEFIMTLAAEGKLATNEKSLQELKPGTLSRLLALRKRILERYKLATAGVDTEKRSVESNVTESESGRKTIIEGATPEEYLEQEGTAWRDVMFHFGKNKGKTLGEMGDDNVAWWAANWQPKLYKGKYSDNDMLVDAALCVAQAELAE